MVEKPEKKVVLNSPADSSIKPSDVTRMSPAAQPGSYNGSEDAIETTTVAKVKTALPPSVPVEDKGRKTIKLKPVKAPSSAPSATPADGAVSMHRETVQSAGAPAVSPPPLSGEEDETVKIEKPHAVTASPPPLPGVKQTIKLRPSSTVSTPIDAGAGAKPVSASTMKVTPPPPAAPTHDDEQTVAVSKRTIRLIPKKPTESQPPVKPSAPTIKLEEPSPEPAPSAMTVKIPEPASESEAPTSAIARGQVQPVKKTLRLKPLSTAPAATPAPPPAPSGATESEIAASVAPEQPEEIPAEPIVGETKETAANEPSIIFTIAATVSLLVMGYFSWVLLSQYMNLFMS